MSLPEMRELLVAASAKAEAALQTELTNKSAQAAICKEDDVFRVYVGALTPTDLLKVKPLPPQARSPERRERTALEWT
jgi:hypothetical protein